MIKVPSGGFFSFGGGGGGGGGREGGTKFLTSLGLLSSDYKNNMQCISH